MDDSPCAPTFHNDEGITEINLPQVMADLKMLTVDIPEEEEVPSGISSRRSLRKRKPRSLDLTTLNRRCSIRPKKRSYAEMENEDDIKEYYLDKSLKKQTNCLETIFEEREETCSVNYMSTKRFRRSIQFNPEPTDSKIKKRRAKIKKLLGSKTHFRRKKVSMQALLDKLNVARSDSPIPTQAEVT